MSLSSGRFRSLLLALIAVVVTLAATLTGTLSVRPAHADAANGSGGLFVAASGRLLSTVTNNDTLHSGTWLSIPVEGQLGIPSTGVSAVQVSFDAINVVAAGSLYADPDGTSNRATTMPYLNYSATAQSNTATLALGTNGAIQVEATSTTDLIVDVEGYYTSGNTAAGGYVPIQQNRLNTVPSNTVYGPSSSVTFNVGTPNLVPSNASAVMLDVLEYAQDSTANGWLSVYPSGSTAGAGQMNWPAGQDYAWTTVVPLPTSGNGNVTITMGPRGSVKLAVSVEGYYTAASGNSAAGMFTPAQANVADTRSPSNPIAGSATRTFQVAGVGGVPAVGSGISSAAVEVELYPTASGQETTYADDGVADLEQQAFTANTPITSFSVVKLGADGGIKMTNNSSGNLNVVVHVEGWFSDLPTGPSTTGTTGSRPSATNLSFGVSDETSAQVDVATGNLLLSTSGLSLTGVNASIPIGASYNSLGWQSAAATLPAANRWTYNFDGTGSLSATGTNVIWTAPDGSTWPFTPDASVAAQFDGPAGLLATITRSSTGYTMKQLSSGQVTQFDLNGNGLSVSDRNSNTVTINRDGADVLSIAGTAGTTAAHTATASFDGSTLTFTQTSGSTSRSVSWTKDSNGNLTSYQDAAGKTTSFAYTGSDLTQITGPAGAVTTITYDSTHRVTQVSQQNTTTGAAGTSTTRLSYTSGTTLVAGPDTDTSVAVATGAHTTYTWNTTTYLVGSVVDAAGRKQAASYNSANLGVSASTAGSDTINAPSPATTSTNTYGANGGQSLTTAASAGGATTTYGYGTQSSSTSCSTSSTSTPSPTTATTYLPSCSMDDAGNTTSSSFDGVGNVTSTSQGSGATAATSTLTLNSDGTTATALAPGNGSNTTGYTYTNHQLTGITPVTGTSLGTKSLTYDGFGRLASESDGAGRTTSYTYDADDRIATISFSDGTGTVTDTYDAAGRLLTEASGSGTVTNTYDQLGHELSTRNSAGGGTVSYTYDKAGNELTQVSSAGTVTNTFDASGVPTSTTYPTSSGTGMIVYVTDGNGRRTDTYAGSNAAHTTWSEHTATSYDPTSGRVQEQQAYVGPASSPTKETDVYYCYNAGNPAPAPGAATNCSTAAASARSKVQWTDDFMSGTVTTYGYDTSGHLTTVSNIGGSAPAGSWQYSYDARGNKLTSQYVTASNGAVSNSTSYTYNAANQITNAGFSYDGAGNLTAVPEYTFAYNGAEQLTTAVHNGSQTTTYTYAGADQKALLSENTTGGTSRSITYGRSDQNGNPTLVTYKVGSGTAQLITDPGTGQAVMLATPSHVDGLYVYDAFGNPVGIVVNSSAAFGEQYDPYGVPTVTYDGGGDGSGNNPYAFKGGTISQAVGLVKFGLRWYDPYTGAWMQQDTLDTPLDPNNANRYAYAADDPVNGADFTGLEITADDALCALGAGPVGVAADAIKAGTEGLAGGTIVLVCGLLTLYDNTDGPELLEEHQEEYVAVAGGY